MVGLFIPWKFENPANKALIYFFLFSRLNNAIWKMLKMQIIKRFVTVAITLWIVQYSGNILLVFENYHLIQWKCRPCHWSISRVPTYICVVSLSSYSLIWMKIWTTIHVLTKQHSTPTIVRLWIQEFRKSAEAFCKNQLAIWKLQKRTWYVL